MAFNLLNLVSDKLDDGLLGQISSLAGINSNQSSSALKSMLPTLIGGLINKGSSDSGAGAILDMIRKGGHDGGVLDNLGNILGGSDSKGFMDGGNSLLSGIFGNNLNSIFNILGKVTGLTRGASGSLMSILAPIVLNYIGKTVKNKGLDALGLKNLLSGQRNYVEGAIPEDAKSLLGFATKNTEATATAAVGGSEKSSGGGGGFGRFLIPLLLAAAALWYFMGRGDKTVAETVDGAKTEVTDMAKKTGDAMKDGATKAMETTKDAAGTVANGASDAAAATASAASWTVNAAGDLVDGDGNVKFKKGEFSVGADGGFLDKDGNKIQAMIAKVKDAVGNAAEKTGEAVEAGAEKVGEAADKVGKAVGNAAANTKESMSAMFSGMFSKKADASTSYSLNDISWDEGHKITNYSKAEIEGLAAALKADTNAKIEVQASAPDDKKVAGMRAKVIENMLITLGVAKGQISSAGSAGAANIAVVVK